MVDFQNTKAIQQLINNFVTGVKVFTKIVTSVFVFNATTAPTTTVDGQVWIDNTDLKYKSGTIVYTVLTVLTLLNWIGQQIGISIVYNVVTGKFDYTVLVDNTGIEINGTSNKLQLKDDGVTKAKINSDVAGIGIDQAVDGSLEVSEGYYALTAATTLTREHKVLSFDTTSASITQPLPEASTMLGHKFEIDFTVKGGSNNLVLTRSGSDSIVCATSGNTLTLSNVYDYLVLQAIAAGKWKIIVSPPSFTLA